MMNWITAVITLAVLWGQQDTDESASASFRSDLEALKEYFHIPGMAAIVTQNGTVIYENYTGQADLDTGRPVDSTTVFPINSLTKTYAAVLIMQLVEAGQLDLDQPVNRYLEDSDLPDSIKIKHFLSHTSEGIPGNFYNYSGFRYHLLAQVLERVTGRQFDLLMNDRILEPQGLSDTHLLLDQARLEALDDRIAKPYFYSGEIQNGQYETAKSASMGLASTARDIAKFDKALSAGKLLSDKSRSEMFTPFPISNGNSPYGFGVFSQVFLGKQLIWGYGQGEYSSSLMLKVIEDDLTLIILANNNQMSDPARLLNGDVTYSLFALSFLKHFVFDLPEKSDWSNLGPEQLDVALSQSAYGPFYRQEHLASALAAAQNGFNDGDSMEVNRSKELVTLALEHFPNYNSYGTQPLMFLIKNLFIHANFTEVDHVVEGFGAHLVEEMPLAPYANLDLGDYYRSKGEDGRALEHYLKISDVDNYSPRAWFWLEALNHVAGHYATQNPDIAKRYYQKIVDIGWDYRGFIDKAKKALEEP